MRIDNSADNNCIDIDCLKEELKTMCEEGTAPLYLDCENILRCIDAGEGSNGYVEIIQNQVFRLLVYPPCL